MTPRRQRLRRAKRPFVQALRDEMNGLILDLQGAMGKPVRPRRHVVIEGAVHPLRDAGHIIRCETCRVHRLGLPPRVRYEGGMTIVSLVP